MCFGVIKVRRCGSGATVESCLPLDEWERCARRREISTRRIVK